MAIRFLKFLKVRGTDTVLDRVQDNIQAAFTDLLTNLTQTIAGLPTPVPVPTPGVIPPSYSVSLVFGGKNSSNSSRLCDLGPSSASINANTGSTPQLPAPFAGTLTTMLVGLDVGYPNGGLPPNETKFTVKIANVDTVMVSDWTTADVGLGTKVGTGTVKVAAGDLISVMYAELSMNGAMTAQATVTLILVAS